MKRKEFKEFNEKCEQLSRKQKAEIAVKLFAYNIAEELIGMNELDVDEKTFKTASLIASKMFETQMTMASPIIKILNDARK